MRIRMARLLPLLLALGCGDAPPPPSAPIQLERISTAVPWPRGLRFVDGKLVVLARGVHRSAGGPQASIEDHAGSLYLVDPAIAEPVVKGQPAGEAVRANAALFAAPTSPPFRLWNREMPPTGDVLTDRPYCMLVYDPPSQNFFVCGYSGIDLATDAKFRKNATDSIHRYDTRDGVWRVVEAHDPASVPEEELGRAVAPGYYPHHDPAAHPPPHGLLNGPCGAVVAGRYLYCGAKDNTALGRYDLTAIRARPDAPPPPAELVFARSGPEDDVYIEIEGRGGMYVEGTCALAVHDGWLYVAFRTTSQIIRLPLEEDGSLRAPLVGQLIAQFAPYDPEKGGGSANIYDMAFDSAGRMYVSPAYTGSVYRFQPDPAQVFEQDQAEPFVDLRVVTDNPKAKSGNIALDADDNLYICSGNKDVPEGDLRGVIYRVAAR